MMRAFRLSLCTAVAACAFSLGATACARDAQSQATALLSAVDGYRSAPNEGKSVAAEQVRKVACTDAQVCDAERTCIGAIDSTVKGLVLDSEVQKALDALERGPAQVGDGRAGALLAQQAKDAQALMAKGHDAMPACEQKLMLLRLKYDVVRDTAPASS